MFELVPLLKCKNNLRYDVGVTNPISLTGKKIPIFSWVKYYAFIIQSMCIYIHR